MATSVGILHAGISQGISPRSLQPSARSRLSPAMGAPSSTTRSRGARPVALRASSSSDKHKPLERAREALSSAAGAGAKALIGLAAAAAVAAPSTGAMAAPSSPSSSGRDAPLELKVPPISPLPDVFKTQQALAESWAIAGELFVDAKLNGADWNTELIAALQDTSEAPAPADAYKRMNTMLGKLGDPFTRAVPPKEYGDFRITSDGGLQGVGILIASDPDSGSLVVLAPLEGGPAERAGVEAGDVLEEIDGKSTVGLNGDSAAQILRGQSGTFVNLKIRRLGESASSLADTQGSTTRSVRVKRESIELSPVIAEALPHGASTLGYIRLTNFSSNAAADMAKAIEDLEGKGASEYILDLRSNPGGLVDAGLDVASMWLGGGSTLVNTVDRQGNKSSFALAPGRQALTDDPLVVLVDGNSASASEILTGALKDNQRARVVGQQTYGKGKIQSVFELQDGGALFVTVAKYKTPSLKEIDQVGIRPDVKCAPTTRKMSPPTSRLEALMQDNCVLRAEKLLPGK